MKDSTVEHSGLELPFSTTEFKISRNRLLRSALFTWHTRLVCIALCLIVAAGMVCAILFDWRWSLVTAMVILVAAPGVMALLYINYAFSPRCLPETYPHTVTFDENGFTVNALVLPLGSEPEAAPRVMSYYARYGEVAKSVRKNDEIVLILRGNPPGLVHIPYNSLIDITPRATFIINRSKTADLSE